MSRKMNRNRAKRVIRDADEENVFNFPAGLTTLMLAVAVIGICYALITEFVPTFRPAFEYSETYDTMAQKSGLKEVNEAPYYLSAYKIGRIADSPKGLLSILVGSFEVLPFLTLFFKGKDRKILVGGNAFIYVLLQIAGVALVVAFIIGRDGIDISTSNADLVLWTFAYMIFAGLLWWFSSKSTPD